MRVGASQDWPLLEKQDRDALADRRLEIRIAQNEVRRLAAELLRHPLHPVRRRLGDQNSGPGRAGERDHVDAGMGRQRLADLRAQSPLTRLKTPAGAPAASTISAKIRPLIGAISLGFRTTVQPAASAGATLQTIWFSGQFHGVIRAATPTGSLTIMRRAAEAAELIGFERLDRRLEMHPPGPDLRVAGERQGRAHFARHRLGEIVGAGVVAVEDALEQREAVLTRGLGKSLEGCAGGGDRAVDVGRRAERRSG